MIVENEKQMMEIGEKFARELSRPACLQLIGDVGAGKTTLVRGLAKGLGVEEPVTSPSYTISKRYEFPGGVLIHYDFYRLDEPGIMSEDLEEALALEDAVVVVEWGGEVEGILPPDTKRIEIKYIDEEKREISW